MSTNNILHASWWMPEFILTSCIHAYFSLAEWYIMIPPHKEGGWATVAHEP